LGKLGLVVRTVKKLLQGKPEGGTIKNLGEREWRVSN